MANRLDILRRMLDTMSISDPEWDITVGTPEYKIMEAVATEIANTLDFDLLHDYHFDIDSKSGIELDNFVNLFGIYRLAAKRAVGTITFSRGTPADRDYVIPSAVQVIKPPSGVHPGVWFQTTTSGTIQTGQSSVEIPIEAVVAGTIGNTPSSTITAIGTGVTGATSVTNVNGTLGGVDAEDDASLRARWKATVFRNMSGTYDQFYSICITAPGVSRAAVIGPQERVIEQLQVTAGALTSQVPDVKYSYPSGAEYVGYDIGTPTQELGVRASDFIYTAATPPTVAISNHTLFPDGAIVDLEYDYTPNCSRNDPANGVAHKIDCFVSGQSAADLSEQIVMSTNAAHTFNNTALDPMLRTQWKRINGTTSPTNGNFFMPLMFPPVLTLPSSIVVGVTTYVLNTDYWLVRDMTTAYGSPRARDGIEWASGSHPANGATVIVNYSSNELILQVDEAINQVRLITTDTMVHAAKLARMRFHLSVVYNFAVSEVAEADNIATAISDWLERKPYHNNVQVSDLIEVVHAVPSVDNVRLTTSAEDAVNYGIMKIAENGTSILSTTAVDVYLNSDEIPILEDVVITVRGQNTF